MRAVYFDCFAGVSGDMIIGAQLDLGVDLESLRQQLASLKLENYEISSRGVQRCGIIASKFDVEVDETRQPARTLADIRSIIVGSSVSTRVKGLSIAVFEQLAESESRVHGTTPDKIHFHEVGAVDSIIDVVGAMIGFEALGVDRFFCSSLRLGSGSVETEHGRLPIPAPATADLLRDLPVYAGEQEGEFVTPTGAAIVATLCERFGPMPHMRVNRVGYGAGSRNPDEFPNALRLMVGELEEVDMVDSLGGTRSYVEPADVSPSQSGSEGQIKATAASAETIVVIETNIDDMNPQVYGFVMERVFALGALDVFMTPVQMKKDRPGVLLTALAKPESLDAIIELLLAETTTLGVRYHEAKRRILERTVVTVDTEFGSIRIKVARDGARTLHFQPEYEDCERAARAANAPFLKVHAAAVAAYKRLEGEREPSE